MKEDIPRIKKSTNVNVFAKETISVVFMKFPKKSIIKFHLIILRNSALLKLRDSINLKERIST